MSIKGREGSRFIARSGGVEHGDACLADLCGHPSERSRRSLSRRRFKINFAELHIARPGAQHIDHGIGVRGADGTSKCIDGAAKSPGVGKLYDSMDRRSLNFRGQTELPEPQSKINIGCAGRARNVRQHCAGLDRGQLIRVTDKNQPSTGPDGLEEPRHHREGDHGHLIDDHDVVRQVIGGVMPESAAIRRHPPQQPMQCRCREVAEPLAVLRFKVRCGGSHCFFEASCGLAGRGRQRDTERRSGLIP
jgi:hypothetical protein